MKLVTSPRLLATLMTAAWSTQATPLHPPPRHDGQTALRRALYDLVVAHDSGLASSTSEWKHARRRVSKMMTAARQQVKMDGSLWSAVRKSANADAQLRRLREQALSSPPHARTPLVESALPALERLLRAHFPSETKVLETVSLRVYQLEL
jgi:hypothetical protein